MTKISAALGILAITLLLSGCSDDGLPSCSSDEGVTFLTDTFNQAQFARQESLSVVEVTDIKEIPSSDRKVQCSAKVSTNSAEVLLVNYHMDLRDDGTSMLEFQVVE
jgi:PBP1b-binding outer membrane lipoprotein LpoB